MGRLILAAPALLGVAATAALAIWAITHSIRGHHPRTNTKPASRKEKPQP